MSNFYYNQNIDENIKELEQGYKSFYQFALSLINQLDKNNGYLKFAVVNMQIALELFLKYYFLVKNEPEKVFQVKKQKAEYRTFNDISSSFYAYNKVKQNLSKHRLVKIAEARNQIVHKGKFNGWCDDTAEYIIECAFFIQEILGNEFEQSILKPNYPSADFRSNPFWKKGASNYAKKLAQASNNIVMECPHCYSRSLVDNSIFDFFEESYIDKGLSCLTCLCCVDLETEGDLIDCCSCKQHTYFVETNNIQPDKTHLGLCFNCGNDLLVRSCDQCGKHYFILTNDDEKEVNGNYYCSTKCRNIALDGNPVS